VPVLRSHNCSPQTSPFGPPRGARPDLLRWAQRPTSEGFGHL